jgi:AcrR family transcriptional regulator
MARSTATPVLSKSPAKRQRAADASVRALPKPKPVAKGRPTLMDDSPRGRLLRAAAHLFLTRGYEQTTVRDLARAVGILSGSIFHHFESKEAILEAVMLEVSTLNAERMRQAAEGAATPMDSVRALVRCELESVHGETSEAMTVLSTEWRSLSPAAQARVLVVRDRYENVWKKALVAARSQLAPIDEFVLRRLVQGMTAGTARWYRPRGPISIDQLADHIVSLVVRARGRHE